MSNRRCSFASVKLFVSTENVVDFALRQVGLGWDIEWGALSEWSDENGKSALEVCIDRRSTIDDMYVVNVKFPWTLLGVGLLCVWWWITLQRCRQ